MWRGLNVFVVRQALYEIAVCLISFTSGLTLSFPSALSPALLGADNDIKVTDYQASWIVTYFGLGGLMGYAFIPTVFEIFGRKTTNIITNLFMLIGSLMLYTSNDVYSLAFARLTQGMSIGGTFVSVLALCECISPKRRGYFMVLNKISLGLGSLACHVLVFITSWRHIALGGTFGNVISIIIFSISAESPSFLAMRGEFDKCSAAFEWYRGNSINAKKELKELITAQIESLKKKEQQKNTSVFKKTQNVLMSNEFRKSFCIVTLAILCLDTSGRYFVLTYITHILIELTNNVDLAKYVSVASDCIFISALCISIVLIKHFNRRTLLFNLGFCSVFLMFMVSFSIILVNKLSILQDVEWLTPSVILLHIFISNIGLVPTAFVLTGEVFSLDHRGLGSFMSGIVFLLYFNIILKLTPIMIDKAGVEGTYTTYGLFLFVFLLLLRIVLPETKDKTLQQIEDEIKGIVRNSSETELIKLSDVSKC